MIQLRQVRTYHKHKHDDSCNFIMVFHQDKMSVFASIRMPWTEYKAESRQYHLRSNRDGYFKKKFPSLLHTVNFSVLITEFIAGC